MENRPKRILIAGAATSAWLNVGDEAILSNMVADLRAAIPNLQISVVSSNPKSALADYGVDEVPAQDIKLLIKTAQASDLIVLGGGGIFYDYWGFNTNELLTPNHTGHGIFVDVALLAALLDKPLMTHAVGVGPLNTQSAKHFTKIVFEQANRITVRDIESKETLIELGIDAEAIRVTADPVFSDQEDFLTSASRDITTELEKTIKSPLVSVVLRSWQNADIDQLAWEMAVAQALDRFLEVYGGAVRFVPFFVEKEDVHDTEVARRVLKEMKFADRAEIIKENASPAEKLKAVVESDLLLGMRLHSMIFAIKNGIPAVALAYDPKVTNLMASIDKLDLNLELNRVNAKVLFSKLAKAYENRHLLKEHFLTKASGLANLAKENAEIASILCNQDSTPRQQFSEDIFDTIKALLIEHSLRFQKLSEKFLEKHQEVEKWIDYNRIRENEYKNLDTEYKNLDTEYKNLNNQYQEETKALTTRLNQMAAFLSHREGELQVLNDRITLMKSSFSWKITRPTRVVARLIRNRGISAQDRNTISHKIRDYYRRISIPNWLDKILRRHFDVVTPSIEKPTSPLEITDSKSPTPITAEFNIEPHQSEILPYWGVRSPHGERRVAMLTNMLLDWEDGRPRFGGGERYALELATLLRELGLKPTFFQPSFQGIGEGDYFGFQVKTFPLKACYGEFHYEGSSYFTEITQNYDHVYYHLPEYASGRIREDGLMTCHGIWFDHKHNTSVVRQPQWFEQLFNAFSNPLGVISVDTHSVSVIRSLWPELAKHMHYIPNFFNGQTNFPDQSKRNPEKLTIIFPRRSQILRGSRIFPEIVSSIPHDVDIFWIGEGDPEDTEIIKGVSARDKRVNFLAADFKEMPAWYQRADIVVIPTLASEGTSLSCLEALASGCATIATNIGGLNDIILNDYNGHIVEPNAQEITQAINFLIENKEERHRLQQIAPESVKYFERRYWREKWANLLLKLGWVEKEAYHNWKNEVETQHEVKVFQSIDLRKEKWVILTRNAIHGGVESLIYEEARYLNAPVIVCGGHEQPETCPFEYTRADDRRSLRKALHDFDVILYHFIPDWAVEVVAESGKPSLEFVHRTDTAGSNKQVPTGLITHSAFLSEFLYEEFGRTSRVVDHPIDTEKFTPSKKEGKFIGAVTSYYKTKGIDLFLRAWAVLKDEFPDIPVKFYGAGDDQGEFEALAKELGVKAEFYPATTRVWEVLPDYRLFVVPSRIEGFPVAILEALAMNVPVVASDLSGIQEFNAKARERGYQDFVTTARAEDVQDLITVLRRELNRSDFPESHDYIAKYYSPKTHCDNLLTAYREFRQMKKIEG